MRSISLGSTSTRHAALFFAVAGLLAFANSLLPATLGRWKLDELGVLDLSIAAVIALVPWQSLHRAASLVIVPVAFVTIALFAAAGALPPYSYAVFYILVFVWIGLSQPPKTSLSSRRLPSSPT